MSTAVLPIVTGSPSDLTASSSVKEPRMTTPFTALRTPLRRGVTPFLMLAFLVTGFTSQATLASAESTWYGPFPDGCYYFWDGAQYVEGRCPRANGSFNVYAPSANGDGGWTYWFNSRVDDNGVEYRTAADGGVVELYPDGSIFLRTAEGFYAVIATDANGAQTLIELGRIDAQGTRMAIAYVDASGTWVEVGTTTTATGSGTPLSEADIAQIHERYNNMQNGMQNGITDNNSEAVCLWVAPSQDYNNDGRTTNSELYDHCAR